MREYTQKYTWHLPLYNALQQDYDNQLAVVAIPCNQFLLQEPGTNPEIPYTYRFVRPGGNFIHTFELAAKIDVNGEKEDPLYTFLKDACPAPKELIGNPDELYFTPIRVNDITWNFEKFLINTSGAPYKRYEPEVHPDNLRSDIDEILAPIKKGTS
ncbi:hypothetical protein LSH36_655g00043 [Paralvinella palmiformis]|uniref:Glutathione peroxidase n=1 Tax=Paralvinella palmiformis TaxID=53620 RepID=A0AAD9J477_9ANNE|nr:hypothetical protein LSH36_655g00043 [Paralvinella palmiformis]